MNQSLLSKSILGKHTIERLKLYRKQPLNFFDLINQNFYFKVGQSSICHKDTSNHSLEFHTMKLAMVPYDLLNPQRSGSEELCTYFHVPKQ